MDNITFKIVGYIVSIVSILISVYLVPWLKNKIGTDKLEQAKVWVNTAVLAAQQVLWDKDGSVRKQWVIDFLQSVLAEHHISVSAEQLDALIESAVQNLHVEKGDYKTTTKAVKKNGNSDTAK